MVKRLCGVAKAFPSIFCILYLINTTRLGKFYKLRLYLFWQCISSDRKNRSKTQTGPHINLKLHIEVADIITYDL